MYICVYVSVQGTMLVRWNAALCVHAMSAWTQIIALEMFKMFESLNWQDLETRAGVICSRKGFYFTIQDSLSVMHFGSLGTSG